MQSERGGLPSVHLAPPLYLHIVRAQQLRSHHCSSTLFCLSTCNPRYDKQRAHMYTVTLQHACTRMHTHAIIASDTCSHVLPLTHTHTRTHIQCNVYTCCHAASELHRSMLHLMVAGLGGNVSKSLTEAEGGGLSRGRSVQSGRPVLHPPAIGGQRQRQRCLRDAGSKQGNCLFGQRVFCICRPRATPKPPAFEPPVRSRTAPWTSPRQSRLRLCPPSTAPGLRSLKRPVV